MNKILFGVGIILLLFTSRAPAAIDDDTFTAGFATAILEHDFHLQASTLTVEHGVVRLLSREIPAVDRARIVSALKEIKGVTDVQIVDAPPSTLPTPTNVPTTAPSGEGIQTRLQPQSWTLFSPTNVFSPLLADPRWPNFSAAYERSIGSRQPDPDFANVSFGESLSLYQCASARAGKLELGIQAAVFATFDLNAVSKDLVNADYFVGPVAEYRYGDVSAILRVFHQSSHLGDEFLLDHPGITRVNLSYEEPDLIISYDLFNSSVRLYAGGGYLVDVDPSNLKPGVIEYGIEYRGPRLFSRLSMVPVAAIDIQNRQQNSWSADVSLRAGVEFQNPAAIGRKVDLLIQYYNGHSPNGQFYLEKIQSIGVGLHFYL